MLSAVFHQFDDGLCSRLHFCGIKFDSLFSCFDSYLYNEMHYCLQDLCICILIGLQWESLAFRNYQSYFESMVID